MVDEEELQKWKEEEEQKQKEEERKWKLEEAEKEYERQKELVKAKFKDSGEKTERELEGSNEKVMLFLDRI
jgi:hypothetical protein